MSPLDRDDELLECFRERGVVRLDGALTEQQVSAIRDTVWRYVERRSAARLSDPATWSPLVRPSFKPLKGRAVFAPFIDNPPVRRALDLIFGPGAWQPPASPRAQILLTFPTPGPWRLPSGWHMDCGFEQPTWPVFAVKLFSFFDEVAPEGGGTLVLSGSHRLVERYSETLPAGTAGNSVTWGRFMKQDPWLDGVRRGGTPDAPGRDLVGVPHVVDGVPLEVTELTGRPGDVVITHFHVFHCGAPNVGNRPRQMLGGTILAS